MEQQDREAINFEEIVQKAVNVDVKTGLRSNIVVQDLDIYCSRGHCSSNNTTSKLQTWRTNAKDSRPKKPKAKNLKSVLSRTNAVEPLKQDKPDKKD